VKLGFPLLLLSATLGSAQLRAQSRLDLLVAEDGRDPSAGAIKPLVDALAGRDSPRVVQALAGLGRFERAEFLSVLAPFLKDPRREVRIAAAHALGQAGQDSSGIDSIGAALLSAAAAESDAGVAGALARSLGRLPWHRAEDAAQARMVVAELAGRSAPIGLLVDAARGLESLYRISGRLLPRDPAGIARLRTLARFNPLGAAAGLDAARIRRAALLTLGRLGEADQATLVAALADPEVEVRRLAVLALADSVARPERRELLVQALRDPLPMVRFEAVRAWGRHFQAEDCKPILLAVSDQAISVSLRAIDQLGTGCSERATAVARLKPLVDSLVGPEQWRIRTIAKWHRGAHALVALATLAPDLARGALSRAGSHSTWQVRMYAALAAGIVGETDRLIVLADDPEDNVREAAVRGLRRARTSAATRIFLSQLERDDHQLLITTATALTGSPNRPGAVSGLLGALRRLTEQGRDNSRDARLGLLDRLAELGGAGQADSISPYLTDFDPAVAERAATVLRQWTGRAWKAEPKPRPKPPIDLAEIDRLQGAILRITMSAASGGGSFDIALLPEVAPVTVARVARLVAQGYYDGLTFHRVEPNFVIQGGGPKANEYTGDGPFLRDEVGPLSHERGTLGISTRGRDTGDAQIFVNLTENLRLDFNYTVWGRIVAGMDVVDSILEGDVIERVDLVLRGRG
jgi:cyclophilin family peptidyl-prolyl cis-trans isomerase/HEAT repeat protein